MITRYAAVALVALASLVGGCSDNKGILGCGCSSDAACDSGKLCDGCSCRPPCADNADCGAFAPNCDPATGRCHAPCDGNADCPDAALPNCGGDGLCFELCDDHADCTLPAAPNCELDPMAMDAGACKPPCANNGECTSATFPNCDSAAGTCLPPCIDNSGCFAAAPNCNPMSGACYGPCATAMGCALSAVPVCDPDTGLCQGACPATACPSALPRCDPSTGGCLPPCTTAMDCTGMSEPNCDPGTGLCFAACMDNGGCVTALPNCDSVSGSCEPPCADNSECPDAAFPNCGAGGVCIAACAGHMDCTNTLFPNCDMDMNSGTFGTCRPPCTSNTSCMSTVFPNCDLTAGTCFGPCMGDPDCPGADICDTMTMLCGPPDCTLDDDCNTMTAGCMVARCVCEMGRCADGCTLHGDCMDPINERCRTMGTSPNRCEPRDCTLDAQCNPPTTVCDTDGGADPAAGGSCVNGCTTRDDCPVSHYCDVPTGACLPRDFKDVGNACPGSDCTLCNSGLGIDDGTGTMTDVCTGFCCSEYDCPPNFTCQPQDAMDPGCSSCVHRLCVPTTGTLLRVGAPCSMGSDCRSGECQGTCQETCCNDAGCGPGDRCRWENDGSGTSLCVSGAKVADVGEVGCQTPPPGPTCDANMCFAFFQEDTACTVAMMGTITGCSPFRDNYCGDWDAMGLANGMNGINDCVFDWCMAECCTTADCNDNRHPSAVMAGTKYYCGSWEFAGDHSTCFVHEGTATVAKGDPCTTHGECGSNYCDTTAMECLERCCTDADCDAMEKCQARTLPTAAGNRLLTVCVP